MFIKDRSLWLLPRLFRHRKRSLVPNPEAPAAHPSWALVLLVLFLVGPPAISAETGSAQTDANRNAITLEALSRLKGIDLEANPSLKAVVLKTLDQVRGTAQFVEIVRDFNLKGQEVGLLGIATSDPAGPAATDAVRMLLQNPDLTAFKVALDGTNGDRLAEALGNTGEKEIVPLLLPIICDVAKPTALRKQAVRALARVHEGAAALLELARAGKLPEDLRASTGSELNSIRWENLKTEAARLLPLPKNQAAKPLPPVSELIKTKGDPKAGAAVFRRDTVGCLKCHQINGEGIDFGPNLSEIGTKLAKEAIYDSVLNPSSGIAFGFEAWQLDLKNGDDALGLIVSETADELTLKTVGGLVTHYKKSDIARRTQQKLSIMPVGLEQTMSVEDLVDLVEYLSSLKKAAR